MNNNKITFSEILEQEKTKQRSFCSFVSDELKNRGIDCSTRQIQKYKSGEVVPSANIIKEILDICEIEMSDSDILNLVEISKAEKVHYSAKTFNPNELKKENNGVIHKRITLKYYDFNFLKGSEIDPVDAIEIIQQRVADEYGEDNNAFNRYITDLIDKDMSN